MMTHKTRPKFQFVWWLNCVRWGWNFWPLLWFRRYSDRYTGHFWRWSLWIGPLEIRRWREHTRCNCLEG